MLDFLRKFYAHTAGKIITILVGLLFIVGFSFLPYIMGVRGGLSPNDVAAVAGKKISMDDLNRYYGKLENEYERMYGNKLTRKELKEFNITGAALSSLIADKVLESKKGVFGLHISDRFIAKNIASFPEFQKNGKFSDKLFKAVLLDNHMTPAVFEKRIKNEIARSYIKRIITESFSAANMQFINDYMIKNKSVSFKIAVFNSKKTAAAFLKKSILYNVGFTARAKKYGGTVGKIPLFSEADLIKSNYFTGYAMTGSILKAVFSTPAGSVASGIFPVSSKSKKNEYAAVKIIKIYFPKYIAAKDKDGKNAMAKQKELYAFRKEREFLDYYVDYLESKAGVKINRAVLSSFRPY